MLATSIAITVALYFAGEGVFNFYLKPFHGFNFKNNYRKTIIHFGTWALVTGAVIYWRYPSFGVIYGLLALAHVLLLYAGWFEHQLNQYLSAKAVEVVFQQGIVALVVLSSKSAGLTLYETTMLFAFLFTILHLSLLMLLPRRVAWIYICGAFLASFFFPFLLWTYPLGIIATYLLHYAFYIAMYFYKHHQYAK